MSDAVRPDWSGRFRALRQANKHDRLDALVVSTPANLRYLTGFAGSAGLLVLTDDAGWLVVDGRYTGVVSEGIAAGELASVRMEKVEQRVDQTLAGLLHRVGAKRIGFEAAHVTVATLRSWQGLTSGVEWLPTERLVERRRVVKDRSSWRCCDARRSCCRKSPANSGSWWPPAAPSGTSRGTSTSRSIAPVFPSPRSRPSSRPGPTARIRTRGRRIGGWPRRPGRAGLRRGVRRILRRPDPDGRGRSGRRRRAERCSTAVREAQTAAIAAVRAGRHRRRQSTRPRGDVLEARGLGSGVSPRDRVTAWASRCTKRPGCARERSGRRGRARGRHGLHDRTGRVRRRARRGSAGGRRARDGRRLRGADRRARATCWSSDAV